MLLSSLLNIHLHTLAIELAIGWALWGKLVENVENQPAFEIVLDAEQAIVLKM